MRVARAFDDVADPGAAAPSAPRGADEFAALLRYDEARFASPEAFLAYGDASWMRELRAVLLDWLDPSRAILSVGSGLGEHEVPLHLAGYDIVASDLIPGVAEPTVALFEGFRAIAFDALDPDPGQRYDDVLALALDYALDDAQLARFLREIQVVLNPGGRVILAQRSRDHALSRVVDGVLTPAWVASRRVRHALRRDGVRVVGRVQAYRRSRAEIEVLARGQGLSVGRVATCGAGVDLMRVPVPGAVLRLAEGLGPRFEALHGIAVFELHAPGTAEGLG